MKAVRESIAAELKATEEAFKMGLLTPHERFSRDFKSKEALKMFIRMTK